MLRPEWITWEELAQCQQDAHESNVENGVRMKCSSLTAAQLQKEVKSGITLVAVNDRKELMGMLSVLYNQVKRWWHHGEAAYICYVAVQPKYKGQGIYKLLAKKADEEITAKGINVEYLHTHSQNEPAIRAYKKDGYSSVRFSPGSGTDYYSVEMAKWLTGHGKNKLRCQLMYKLSEIVVRMLYKPGKIRRI